MRQAAQLITCAIALVLLSGSHCPGHGDPPLPKPNCEDVCYTYGQLVAQERIRPEQEGYQYLAPTADPVVLKIRTIPFDQGGGSAIPPVDDQLYVVVKSTEPNSSAQQEIWRVNYPTRDSNEQSFRKNALYPGRNEVTLWYRNTAGPDAHFFAQVGGLAFGGSEEYSTTYKEGLSFGAGNPPYLISRLQGYGIVRSTKIFASRVTHPSQQTGCGCPGLP